jgi:hypothetical protein
MNRIDSFRNEELIFREFLMYLSIKIALKIVKKQLRITQLFDKFSDSKNIYYILEEK